MNYINTLEAYDSLRKAGFTEEQARAQVIALDRATGQMNHSFKDWLKETKSDFASNRLVTIMGTLIAGIGGTTLIYIFNFSHRITIIETILTQILNKS
jgi:hypothetical protein